MHRLTCWLGAILLSALALSPPARAEYYFWLPGEYPRIFSLRSTELCVGERITIYGSYLDRLPTTTRIRLGGLRLGIQRISAGEIRSDPLPASATDGRPALVYQYGSSWYGWEATIVTSSQQVRVYSRPPATVHLTATAAATGEVTVSWLHDGAQVGRFELQRWHAGGWVGTTYHRSLRSVTLTGLGSGIHHEFRMRVHNPCGSSAFSNRASALVGRHHLVYRTYSEHLPRAALHQQGERQQITLWAVGDSGLAERSWTPEGGWAGWRDQGNPTPGVSPRGWSRSMPVVGWWDAWGSRRINGFFSFWQDGIPRLGTPWVSDRVDASGLSPTALGALRSATWTPPASHEFVPRSAILWGARQQQLRVFGARRPGHSLLEFHWDGGRWNWVDHGKPQFDGDRASSGIEVGASSAVWHPEYETGAVYVTAHVPWGTYAGDAAHSKLFERYHNGSRWVYNDLGAPIDTVWFNGPPLALRYTNAQRHRRHTILVYVSVTRLIRWPNGWPTGPSHVLRHQVWQRRWDGSLSRWDRWEVLPSPAGGAGQPIDPATVIHPTCGQATDGSFRLFGYTSGGSDDGALVVYRSDPSRSQSIIGIAADPLSWPGATGLRFRAESCVRLVDASGRERFSLFGRSEDGHLWEHLEVGGVKRWTRLTEE